MAIQLQSYDVELTQISRAFYSFLQGQSDVFEIQEQDALERDVHEWDDYLRIDVGHYIQDIEFVIRFAAIYVFVLAPVKFEA